MAVDPEQISHLEELIATLRRRRRILERQRAGYGELAVPAHIQLEIEDIAQQLSRYQIDLRRLRPMGDTVDSPYLGLLTFQENDAARFFGRDALVTELVERVRSTAFLTVLGASGSGKSSLVRAGLIPSLKHGVLEGSAGWRYMMLKPGARPLDVLAAELAKLQGGDLDSALRLSHSLAENEQALVLAAEMLLDRANNQRLVVVVDQFEELWTQTPSEQRDKFIRLLLAATEATDAPLLLLVTMRADFLHRAIEQRPLAERIERHVALVSPMQPEELRDAIERPIESLGSFEPGLVEELIEQVRDRPGALPLLEFTLLELWKRRERGGSMTWAAYRELGGVEGALAARADAILAERYTPEQQVELRQLLLRLVQPGEGAADTRRRARLDDLVPAGMSLDTVQLLLKPLVDERLLVTTDEQPAIVSAPHSTADVATASNQPPVQNNLQSSTVEISHEALIRAWPTFGRWVGEARADLRFQLQVEEAAKEWDGAGRNEDLLWSGLRLAQADAWLERAQPRLNARDQAFLETSHAVAQARHAAEEAERRERERLLEERAAAERRSASRLRVFLAVGTALLLVALVLAAYALNQTSLANKNAQQSLKDREIAETQARNAKAQANASESLFEFGRGNADQAILLARASILTDTQQPFLVVRATRAALQAVPNVSLRSHTGMVAAVAWSPDGKQILTGSWDKTAKIWDVATRQVVMTFTDPDLVSSVAWRPDGKQILVGSWDGTAKVWDVATGRAAITLDGHHGSVMAVAWSPDGKQILTGSWDETAKIWEVSTGTELLALTGHTHPVVAVAWSPDGKHVATGSYDHTAVIWDTTARKPVHILADHGDQITSVAWSPDGKLLLTGSYDHTAKIWDITTGKAIETLEGHASQITSVAWSPDGKRALTGYADGSAQIWDAATGQMADALEGDSHQMNGLAWSPDGKYVLTGGGDKTAKIWDITASKAVRTVQGATGRSDAVWSPDGRYILTAGDEDNSAKIWDVATGKAIKTLKGHGNSVTSVAWSPDGTRVLTGSWDRTAKIWDAATGREIATLKGHTNFVSSVAWSPDGKRILTGSYDQTAKVWDAATGQEIATLKGHTDQVASVAWSPDGTRVLTGSWDKTAKIWNISTQQAVVTLEGHTNTVWAVAWSPDGTRVLTGSWDNTAKVWDAATGENMLTLKGHSGEISAVAWSGDGQDVLTGSGDTTARIWDVATGTPTTVLEGHSGEIWAASWSPDGRQILTGSGDTTAKIWIAHNEPIIAELTRRLCAILPDADIVQEIPAWRGCSAELAAVKAGLAEYDQLLQQR